jgi:hypothetical protein
MATIFIDTASAWNEIEIEREWQRKLRVNYFYRENVNLKGWQKLNIAFPVQGPNGNHADLKSLTRS